MSRLGRLVKWGVLATSLVGGWHFYQHYLDRSAGLDEGRAALEHGDFDRAIPLLEAAYHDDPDDLTICLDLADCCARSGQDRDALAWYHRAEPLLNREGSSISLMRHRQQYTNLSQKTDWSSESVPWRGAKRR